MSSPKDNECTVVDNQQKWVCAFGVFAFLIAFLNLVGGWWYGITIFLNLRADYAAMVPTTAISILLCAASILCLSLPLLRYAGTIKKLILTAALLVAAGAATDLLLLYRGIANGIDAYIAPQVFAFQNFHMSIATAFNLLLMAICLLRLVAFEPRRPDYLFIVAATLGLVSALVTVLGYSFDVSALYAISWFSAMALHTAIAFAALFIGALLLRPGEGWIGILLGKGQGSISARRLIPLVFLVPLTFCLITLWATKSGYFDANFRLSILAIFMMVILSASVLYSATLGNRSESTLFEANLQLKSALQDRELLLQEVYHRIKNNLQMTNSLLRIDIDLLEDTHSKQILTRTTKRIEALGRVHNLLVSAPIPSQVSLRGFVEDLCANIELGSEGVAGEIPILIEAPDKPIHIDFAVPFGLLLNELITNSIKHAFPDRDDGAIRVDIREGDSGDLEVTISDNGIGLNAEEPGLMGGNGLLITRGLAEQLNSSLSFDSTAGTVAALQIPKSVLERGAHERK